MRVIFSVNVNVFRAELSTLSYWRHSITADLLPPLPSLFLLPYKLTGLLTTGHTWALSCTG